jgi:hypothetical protein
MQISSHGLAAKYEVLFAKVKRTELRNGGILFMMVLGGSMTKQAGNATIGRTGITLFDITTWQK